MLWEMSDYVKLISKYTRSSFFLSFCWQIVHGSSSVESLKREIQMNCFRRWFCGSARFNALIFLFLIEHNFQVQRNAKK